MIIKNWVIGQKTGWLQGNLKTLFREKKGLQVLMQLIFHTGDDDFLLLQTAMYALSCAIDSCGKYLISYFHLTFCISNECYGVMHCLFL